MLRFRLEWETEQLKEKIGVVILESRNEPETVQCAAMLVPRGQEQDWVFASESGQLQLLTMSGVSRLILLSRGGIISEEEEDKVVGKEWRYVDENDETLKQCLRPLLARFGGEDVPFVSYEDGVTWRKMVDKVASPLTGMLLVEDVRLESGSLRRRLRFKEMPNLIQTEFAVFADEQGQFTGVDHTVLVHVYLAPLVAGLSLVSRTLEACVATTGAARVLCIGVGGGALPMFLSRRMDELHVEAVDLDEVVVDVARRHFGLVEGKNLQVHAENGLAAVERIAEEVAVQSAARARPVISYVQAIIVDVSAGDGLSCPPPAFVDGTFLSSARSALDSGGILAMNIMPGVKTSHYELIQEIATFFEEVYEIEVSDGENFAVFALPAARREADETCNMLRKLRSLVGDDLINKIRRVA